MSSQKQSLSRWFVPLLNLVGNRNHPRLEFGVCQYSERLAYLENLTEWVAAEQVRYEILVEARVCARQRIYPRG